MITVKNLSTATVVINVPEAKFRRSLVPGREVPLSQEEYNDLTFDPGIQNMVRGGYIRFKGVEEGTEIESGNDAGIKDKEEVEAIIANRDVVAFAKFMPTASPAAREVAVQYAVENNVTDNAFVALIKKYCDVDVINAISIKRKAEEK